MLKGYHSINVEGEGLSFLFEFTGDSTASERGSLIVEVRGLGSKSDHEYFDKKASVWVVNFGFGVLNKSQAHGVRVRVGRALSDLGYRATEKVKR